MPLEVKVIGEETGCTVFQLQIKCECVMGAGLWKEMINLKRSMKCGKGNNQEDGTGRLFKMVEQKNNEKEI